MIGLVGIQHGSGKSDQKRQWLSRRMVLCYNFFGNTGYTRTRVGKPTLSS
ncbi:hypothetical protein C2W64_02638 [Brevibacillus laterosporus]|nr:hypothetical protein C2W64_02638 [Brevibacillus laterosporus]